MKTVLFRKVRAKNILCFGEEGIEIHFQEYGNIVLVKGINLDNPGSDDCPASNGAGKSSIQELLSIGLYGKTIKNTTKVNNGDFIHEGATQGEVEIIWDNYRLVRNFKKSKSGTVNAKVDLWKSPHFIWDEQTLISKGKGTTEINNEVIRTIGLQHHPFCNVGIFDERNTYAFMKSDAEKKRGIVENLLDLEQYRLYHANAKAMHKEVKDRIAALGKQYSSLGDEVEACERRLATVVHQEATWRAAKKNELSQLETKLTSKQEQLLKTNTGEQLDYWQKAQDRLTALSDEIIDLESKRSKIIEVVATARQRLETSRQDKFSMEDVVRLHRQNLSDSRVELDKAMKLIANLEGLKEGTPCPVCHGTINRDNYGDVLDHARHQADDCRSKIELETTNVATRIEQVKAKDLMLQTMEQKITEADSKVAVIDSKIRKNRTEISQLSQIKKPDGNVAEQVLEVEITEIKKQIKLKQEECNGGSPYEEIIQQSETEKAQKIKDREDKAAELSAAEAELPYYEFWLEAFGDNGIRKFVIDGIIPALNEWIAHWLHILIDGCIDVTMDNKLDHTIKRNGRTANYWLLSNGELTRADLSVSQAFAYVMMLNSGTCLSVVFLDEITGGGIDRAGVAGIYNMIVELGKERQVFVTTHNETLLQMLDGCTTLTLQKQNDVTTLVS